MKTLGGSLFIRNGIKFDYCFLPALDSLLYLCDEVVIMDCQSTDGTLEVIENHCKRLDTKVKIIANCKWEVGIKHERLAILANKAKDYLETDYYFSLQADEVIHESSFPAIWRAINSGLGDTYLCRRINLYRDFNSHIKDVSTYKPCSNRIIRLGKKHMNSIGDAESLEAGNCCINYVENIIIYHYGFVRRDKEYIDKVIDMQEWFFGNKNYVDKRIVAMRNKDYKHDAESIIPSSELDPLPMEHPIFARGWIEEREKL